MWLAKGNTGLTNLSISLRLCCTFAPATAKGPVPLQKFKQHQSPGVARSASLRHSAASLGNHTARPGVQP
jgi:hypothetical protein